MKVIDTRPREICFVLWGHCQNLLDDPRTLTSLTTADFFGIKYLQHVTQLYIMAYTSVGSMGKRKKSKCLLSCITNNECEFYLLIPFASVALPNCLFKGWHLLICGFICLKSCSLHCHWNYSILHQDEQNKMQNIRMCKMDCA